MTVKLQIHYDDRYQIHKIVNSNFDEINHCALIIIKQIVFSVARVRL